MAKTKGTNQIDMQKSGTVTGLVKPISNNTFYTKYGFIFPYLCTLLLIVLLVFSVTKKK